MQRCKIPFLSQHFVLAVKGFFRRANLIPNRWKLRIGATHELFTKLVDNSVQVQGFPGRMTGYWRYTIESGHKTGPHRTSIRAIEEYEIAYEDPFGLNSYQSSGFKKKNGQVSKDTTMLSVKNIKNLEHDELQIESSLVPRMYRVYRDENVTREVCKILGYQYKPTKDNINGFKETSLNQKKRIASLQAMESITVKRFIEHITLVMKISRITLPCVLLSSFDLVQMRQNYWNVMQNFLKSRSGGGGGGGKRFKIVSFFMVLFKVHQNFLIYVLI